MCPPTPPVWRPGSLGWAGRSSQVFRRKRGGAIQAGGTHWSGGKKGAEDRAATAQKRPQGAGQEPGCGLPGEDEEQLLVQGRLIRWGLSTLQAPHALNPSQKRAAWPPGASGGGGRQAQGRHCLCPGLSWAIVPSDLPKPSGMGSCPCNLTQRARQGGVQSHRQWATGRRAQAWGRRR